MQAAQRDQAPKVDGQRLPPSDVSAGRRLEEPGLRRVGHPDVPRSRWELSLGIYLTVKGFKAAPGFFDHTRNGAAADGALTPAAAAR